MLSNQRGGLCWLLSYDCLSASNLLFLILFCNAGTGTIKMHFSVISWPHAGFCKTRSRKREKAFRFPVSFLLLLLLAQHSSSPWKQYLAQCQAVSVSNLLSHSQNQPLCLSSEEESPEQLCSSPWGFESWFQHH